MATAAVAAALSGQMGVGGSYVLPPSRLADSVIQWYRAQRDWSWGSIERRGEDHVLTTLSAPGGHADRGTTLSAPGGRGAA